MLSIPFEFSYLALSIALVPIWILALYFNRFRKQQIVISLAGGALSGLSELLFIPDYWTPPRFLSVDVLHAYISVADILFGFCFVGIFLGAVPYLMYGNLPGQRSLSWKSLWLLISIGLCMLGISYVLMRYGLNSIFATSLSMFCIAVAILVAQMRFRLLFYGLGMGCVAAIIMFSVYWLGAATVTNFSDILMQIWTLDGTRHGTLIAGVPLTELIFAFSAGVYASLFFVYRV